jgi:hypothetical protein
MGTAATNTSESYPMARLPFMLMFEVTSFLSRDRNVTCDLIQEIAKFAFVSEKACIIGNFQIEISMCFIYIL